MAEKIRLTRMGRRHRPFFRINAVDSRTPRDGRILEKLGHYDPLEKDITKKAARAESRPHRVLAGPRATPSDTVSEILLRNGIKHKYAEEKECVRPRPASCESPRASCSRRPSESSPRRRKRPKRPPQRRQQPRQNPPSRSRRVQRIIRSRNWLLQVEIQNSKSETNSKHENQMTETLSPARRSRFEFWILIIRACFGFRNSDFELPARQAR